MFALYGTFIQCYSKYGWLLIEYNCKLGLHLQIGHAVDFVDRSKESGTSKTRWVTTGYINTDFGKGSC